MGLIQHFINARAGDFQLLQCYARKLRNQGLVLLQLRSVGSKLALLCFAKDGLLRAEHQTVDQQGHWHLASEGITTWLLEERRWRIRL
jgi:hypothetical protein